METGVILVTFIYTKCTCTCIITLAKKYLQKYDLFQMRDLRAVGIKFWHVLYPKSSTALLRECKLLVTVLYHETFEINLVNLFNFKITFLFIYKVFFKINESKSQALLLQA